MKTMRGKMMLLSILILAIMAVIWLSMSLFHQQTVEQYNNILQRNLLMNEASQQSQQSLQALNQYRSLPSEESLEKYREEKRKLYQTKTDLELLRNRDNAMLLANVQHMIESQTEAMDLTIRFQQDSADEDAADQLAEASSISGYISQTTLRLISGELQTYDAFYRKIITRSHEITIFGFWTLALVSLILLLFSYVFVKSVTQPILKLTQAARELSRGSFRNAIEVNNNDEMSFLAKTLDNMRISIGGMVDEIQSNAQLEYDLHKHKLMLKESELKSLQSQINPHFLFNTLNMLAKEAYIAGAEHTSELISSVAGMLRYNLRRMDSRVTLREEIDVLEEYFAIQKARFGERLQISREIDDSCLDFEVPILILQPLAENAFIHAIEPSENGGTITLRTRGEADYVLLQIEDTGEGMDAEQLEKLLSEEGESSYKGHSTGIGIHNVLHRLQLFYGVQDVMKVESKLGEGTRMTVKLPRRRGMPYDTNAHRG